MVRLRCQYARARKATGNDRQLPGLDADIERHERGQELGPRQPEIAQHAGESHSMQQAEREHQRQPPRLQFGDDEILDRHVDNRQRNHRLDHLRRQRHNPIHRQRQGDRVREGKRADLRHDGSPARREQEDAEHEQDVIETVGQDMGEAERKVLPRHVATRERRGGRRQRHGLTRGAADNPMRLDRPIADSNVERIGAQCQAVAESDMAGAGWDAPCQTYH